MKLLVTACVVLATASAWTYVVPNGLDNVDGDGQFFLTTTTATGRVYMMVINQNQLTGIVGQDITGMRFRLTAAATSPYPTADANFADFDIHVGAGVDPALISTTIANNFSAASTQVRNGALTFTAGSFGSGGNPNAFGQAINFDSAYTYTGGHLTVVLRFAAVTGFTTAPAFDAVTASGGPGNGYGVNFASRFATDANSSVAGTTGNFVVADFVTNAIPEPATMTLVGLAGLALLRRRRA